MLGALALGPKEASPQAEAAEGKAELEMEYIEGQTRLKVGEEVAAAYRRPGCAWREPAKLEDALAAFSWAVGRIGLGACRGGRRPDRGAKRRRAEQACEPRKGPAAKGGRPQKKRPLKRVSCIKSRE